MATKLAAILLVGLCAAGPALLNDGYTRTKTHLGGNQYSKVHSEEHKHSVVYFPDIEALSKEYMDRATKKQNTELDLSTITCQWGEGPDYFRFLPQQKAQVFKNKGPVSFSNHCFQKVTAEITSFDADSVEVTITSSDASSWFCYDTYFVAILNSFHVEKMDFSGKHRFTFKNLSDEEIYDIEKNGVRIFVFCDGLVDLFADFFMTLKLFLGGFSTNPHIPIVGSHTTWYMDESNIKFLEHSIGYKMEKRPVSKVNIPESEIHSGDFLAITRLDGLDEIIMYGSGSRVGHSTMALWIEEDGKRELYIVESQDGWYWPVGGFQKNKFSQWMEWAENASFNIAVLPLKPEVRAKFNETAAYEWFKSVEGTPYGYHNFLFGWIDTPRDNFPPLLPPEILPILFRVAEKIIPKEIDSILNEALNKRLGTEGLRLQEIEVEAGKQGKGGILDLMAEVEQEGWVYSDGISLVCSSFVLAMYKRAGILGDLELSAPEFTPRDVTSLNLFDLNYDRPQACKDADPDLPYCQILGNYRIDLGPEYSTIEPYNHMNERCPSIAPEFKRPAGC